MMNDPRLRIGTLFVLGTLALLALARPTHPLTPAYQEARTVRGTWALESKEPGEPQLVLRLGEGWEGHESRLSAPDDLRDEVLAAVREGQGELIARVVREAGAFEFRGTARGDEGSGTFTLTLDPAYLGEMEALGYSGLRDHELLAAAAHGAGPRQVRALAQRGYEDVSFGDLLATAIFRVDGGFIDEMQDLELGELELDQLVAFRIFDVDADFVAQARGLPLGRLDAGDLIAMRVHKLDPAFLREMEAQGVELEDVGDALALAIHDIDAGFVAEARGLGLGELDVADLVAMKIHGVDQPFVTAMRDVGFPPEDLGQAVAFRIHGVTPDFVRELEEAGYEDLTGNDLLTARILGPDWLRKERGRSEHRH